ncbi:FAD-dependent oxidoreductase [Halarcobacter anaerophilus]|jgi:malate dehydrogenase (quinone)|uniref:malate dehydrogenase (quinone) n=1 Tax=Halarcobacter anaerophilus TaxID=877500 RepID=A0A4Q0XXF5_9BACT|nr:FAD-dependent oxidoreductase [Halarcobacter anaerophilus]QDF28207.1 malate:quinone-oxidoreductase [Halarcobacter anaerophilus]RXJ61364.1 malate:quinone oxidoreductase [Halarcobacter anaerophilus]
MNTKHYDVIIVGGGISGAALFYELARYSDAKSICMLEKYEDLATLNSKGTSNSQTIHVGDIETNYTLDKAKITKRTARMIVKFNLMRGLQDKIMFAHQKMALGVGEKEVEFITNRYEEFKQLFPYLELWDKEKLREVEPKLVYADKEQTKDRPEPIVAMGTQSEYTTVDFGAMTKELVKAAQEEDKVTDVFFNAEVDEMEKVGEQFKVTTTSGSVFTANFVVVNAGAHSLYLAHKMGYGKHMGSLSMAGSFYITNDHFLNGKVYMVQNPKLPFAALHGDPDILCDGKTRFGPTALALLVLERYKGGKSFFQCLKTMNFDGNILKIFWDLLKDRDIRNYVFKNFLFEVPGINKGLFVKDARKIVPSLDTDDIEYAKGFGGVRPQVLNKEQQKLMLGEASINPGDGIIFNMTPSPGATSCLGNAERDIRTVCEYLNLTFDEAKFKEELTDQE